MRKENNNTINILASGSGNVRAYFSQYCKQYYILSMSQWSFAATTKKTLSPRLGVFV